jgi:hypothetical protein
MDKKLIERVCIGLLIIALFLVLSLQCGCAVVGTFKGKVLNPEGEIVYTFEGDSDGSIGFSEEFASAFSFMGLGLEELIVLGASIAGVSIGGGVVVKKKRGKRNAKQAEK